MITKSHLKKLIYALFVLYLCITSASTDSQPFLRNPRSQSQDNLTDFKLSNDEIDGLKKRIDIKDYDLGNQSNELSLKYSKGLKTLIVLSKHQSPEKPDFYIVHVANVTEMKFKTLEFNHSNSSYPPNMVNLKEGSYSFYSREINKIFHNSNFDMIWTIISTPASIKQFFVNPKNASQVVFICKNGTDQSLVSTNDGGINFVNHGNTIVDEFFQHKWLSKVNDTFLTVQLVNIQPITTVNIAHLKNGNFKILLSNCNSLKHLKGIYFSTCEREEKKRFYISLDGENFQECIMPKKMTFKSFSVPSINGGMVFVTAINTKLESVLFSAPYVKNQDLMFRRILSDIVSYLSLCPSIMFHPSVDGIIIVFTKINYHQNSSAKLITFNYGNTWQNVETLVISHNQQEYKCVNSCKYNFNNCENTEQEEDPNYTPWLIIRLGNFYHQEIGEYPGLFVSRNTGFSWRLELTGSLHYTTLDYGAIILISHLNVREIMLSIDECRTFIYVNISSSTVNVQSIVSFYDPNNMKALIIANDLTKSQIFLVDLNQLFNRKCINEDYNHWNLQTTTGNCFLGQIYRIMYRKTSRLCQIEQKISRKFEKTQCPCTNEDFGCEFGYIHHQGKCILDPEHINEHEEHIASQCQLGSLFKRTVQRTHLVRMSHCLVDGMEKPPTSESELCIPFNNLEMIIAYFNNRIEVVDINDYPKSGQKSQILLQFNQNVEDAVLDLHSKTIYAVIKKQIYFYQYAYDETVNVVWEKLNVDAKVKNLHFDFDGQNLYFQNIDNVIEIYSIKNGLRKSNLSNSVVDNFKIYPHLGIMLIKDPKSKLELCRMDATECVTIAENDVGDYSVDEKNKTIIYFSITNKSVIRATAKSFFNDVPQYKLPLINPSPDIEHLVVINSKIMIYHKGTLEMHLPNKSRIEKTSLDLTGVRKFEAFYTLPTNHRNCQNFNCNGICIDAFDRPKCWCLDGYELNGAICVKVHSNNKTVCMKHQKACNNGQCVDSKFWCDGNLDCHDGSDEKNCTKTGCNAEQFTCKSGKCVPQHHVCNGHDHCGDNSDENCDGNKGKEACKSEEFTCQDNNCIPQSKLCDGLRDCPDGTDEDKCEKNQCNFNEFRCLDGKCVNEFHVCDNHTDCTFEEDEAPSICGCHFFCKNGTCIDKLQICNNVVDCHDGEDERNCVQITEKRLNHHLYVVVVIVIGAILLLTTSSIGKKLYLRLKMMYLGINLSVLNRRTSDPLDSEDEHALILDGDQF